MQALPRRAEDLRDRRLEAGVGVANREAHTHQPAGDEASQARRPKRVGFGFADVDADDLAPPGLVHAMRDDQRLDHQAPAVADFSTLASRNT